MSFESFVSFVDRNKTEAGSGESGPEFLQCGGAAEAGGAAQVERGAGGAIAQRLAQGQPLVHGIDDARAERIARAIAAHDALDRERRDLLEFSGGVEGGRPLRIVDDDPRAESALEEQGHGAPQRLLVKGAVWAPDGEPESVAGLDLVDGQAVEMGDGREDGMAEALGRVGDAVDGGQAAALAHLMEQPGGAGAVVGVLRVQPVEDEEMPEIEDLGADVEVRGAVGVEAGVCASAVEERAASLAGHDVGVAGRGVRDETHPGDVDAASADFSEDPASGVVVTEAACGIEGDVGAERGEVEEDVAGASAGRGLLAEDGAEIALAGPVVDVLDDVGYPVSGADDASAFCHVPPYAVGVWGDGEWAGTRAGMGRPTRG